MSSGLRNIMVRRIRGGSEGGDGGGRGTPYENSFRGGWLRGM
jgi:hypothetical protein